DADLFLAVADDGRVTGVGPAGWRFESVGLLQGEPGGRRGPGQVQLTASETVSQPLHRGHSRHAHWNGSNDRLAGHVERFVLRPAKAKVRDQAEPDLA